MFEKRKSLSYKYDYALDLVGNDNDRIERLIEKSVIRQNGNYLEIDDQFLHFFEQILEVNEEINVSYINENLEQVKQYILYYLQESSEVRKYTYLKSVKSTLKKIGRITIRNIVDLNRNIENTFKTEPNYRVKISKLENQNRKLADIRALIEQTEKLITEDELTFFKSASDEELKSITNQLRLQLSESRHNLIESKKQIIEFINQIKYQSQFIEKLRQIKYLKDQFELKAKTNIIELLAKNCAMIIENKLSYPLKLSLDWLQQDATRESILKINKRVKSGVKPSLNVAENISKDYLQTESEKEVHINLEEVRNNFIASGNHLFDFLLNYNFPREVMFDERVTLFCQMISVFDDHIEVTEDYKEQQEIEYVMVYPKRQAK
jgi:hypothetical protein